MDKALVKKATQSTLLLLFLVFVGDRILGSILEYLQFSVKTGEYHQTTAAIVNPDKDIAILGSSRAMHHYIPDAFEKELDLSAYNYGLTGKNILYSYAIFSQMMQAPQKPKMVVLDVQPVEFVWRSGKLGEEGMVATLLPYREFPLIRESIREISRDDLILADIFKTYAYNSRITELVATYAGLTSFYDGTKGFVPLKGEVKRNPKFDEYGSVADPKLVKAYEAFLALAKKNDINLYVVVSPTINKARNSIPLLKSLSQKYRAKFLDFSDREEFHQYSLYNDSNHLNEKGARLFTEALIKQLKSSGLPPNNRLAGYTKAF